MIRLTPWTMTVIVGLPSIKNSWFFLHLPALTNYRNTFTARLDLWFYYYCTMICFSWHFNSLLLWMNGEWWWGRLRSGGVVRWRRTCALFLGVIFFSLTYHVNAIENLCYNKYTVCCNRKPVYGWLALISHSHWFFLLESIVLKE